MNIYSQIAPTYLYIKQHSITKKKYFGKTTRPDPINYLGSGVRWCKHINKHGKQFVETLWLSDLYTDTSISEHALHFSTENNIVESDDWANLIPENGLDGGDNPLSRTPEIIEKSRLKKSKPFSFLKDNVLVSGTNLSAFCKLHNLNQAGMHGVLNGRLYICSGYTSSNTTIIEYWKIETPKRKKEGIEKQANSTRGIKKSDEYVRDMQCHQNNKIQVECPHCNKVGQLTNMKAWHFDKCKLSPNYICDDITCIHCGAIGPRRTIKRYHNDNCTTTSNDLGSTSRTN
jgi:hypothetical protein